MNPPRQSIPLSRGGSGQIFLLGSLLFGALFAAGAANSMRLQGRLPQVRFGYYDQHHQLIAENKRDGLSNLRTAALIDFDNAAAQIQLLSAAYQFNNSDSVVLALRGLLNHTPDDAELHGRLAVALLETGQPDEAVLHINRAVKLDPANAMLLSTHGAIMLALERFSEAEASDQKALELNPNSEPARRPSESLLPHY